MNTKTSQPPELLGKVAAVWELCPDMRFGQLIATLGLLAEDATDRALWDLEDADFLAALERFRGDLVQRQRNVAS